MMPTDSTMDAAASGQRMCRLVSLKYRLGTIELIRSMKERRSYRELARLTGFDSAELCRYVQGRVCPSMERAEEISRVLLKAACLYDFIAQKIERDSEGYMDASRVVTDPFILKLAAHHAVDMFKQVGVTKVVAASVDGVPLGTLVAQRLGAGVIIAKGEKKAGIRSFLADQYDGNDGLLSLHCIFREALFPVETACSS